MTFRRGDWNAICDRCGFEYRASELRRDWRGLMLCKEDFEPRHPQELIRARPADRHPYGSRSLGEVTFLSPGDVTADDL